MVQHISFGSFLFLLDGVSPKPTSHCVTVYVNSIT